MFIRTFNLRIFMASFCNYLPTLFLIVALEGLVINYSEEVCVCGGGGEGGGGGLQHGKIADPKLFAPRASSCYPLLVFDVSL